VIATEENTLKEEEREIQALFGADKIPFTSINDLQATAPDIIVYAAPFMFLFVLIEYFVSRYQSHDLYEKKETIGSILVGSGNVLIGLFIKTVLFYLFILAYNWIPWRMELAWWTVVPCYIVFDFCSYWAHRISHHVRFLWGTHVTHHSADHYNLTVSFRLSWIQYVKIVFFFPVALMGFHPIIIFVTNQVAILYQFWQHTEYIKKLHPIVEFIFATPSSHRVHHGSQEKYINKNFGATFAIWDRMFGTYQPEEEKVVYGLTHTLERKHDPIHINFHEYVDIFADVRRAKSFREAMFYIFGDPVDVATMKQRAETVRSQKQKKIKVFYKIRSEVS
jgi:sterol desaturase/sphingolipid hydroxylase (fatty acid hydroxylase superfamily)